MKKIKVLLFIIIVIILIPLITSCGFSAQQKINKVNKLNNGKEYQFVHEKGITKNNESFFFENMIIKEIKSKFIIKNNNLSTRYCYLLGDYYFFLYKYYSNPNFNSKYVVGYIDLINIDVNIIKIYDLEPDATVKIAKFGNKIAFIDTDLCTVCDSVSLEVTTLSLNDYNFLDSLDEEYIIFNKENGDNYQYKVIDDEFVERIFELEKDCYIRYIVSDHIIYKKGFDIFGIDLTTNESISNEKLDEILSEIQPKSYIKDNLVNGKKYTYKINDSHNENRSKRGFLVFESDEYEKVVSVDELGEQVNEIKEVEKIYDEELFFKEVFFGNNEIYISLVHYDCFFGICSDKTVAIVIKYDIENNNFKYIGYYDTIHYDLIKVYKLS